MDSEVGDEGADHYELSVSEVDYPHQAKDHGQAACYEQQKEHRHHNVEEVAQVRAPPPRCWSKWLLHLEAALRARIDQPKVLNEVIGAVRTGLDEINVLRDVMGLRIDCQRAARGVRERDASHRCADFLGV